MTRAQRALAFAIAIVPLTVAGIRLVKCGCATDAYIIEIVTAVGYLIFILVGTR